MKAPIVFILAAAAMLAQSCKLMYVPNAQNVPLLKEKNEVRATLGYSNASLAYGATDHIGVMLNAQYKTSHWAEVEGRDSRKLLLEAGAGLFNPHSSDGVVEAYGGVGMGRITFDDPATDSTIAKSYEVNTVRFFVQPVIGVTRERVDYAFSMRVVGLQFLNVRTNYTEDELDEEGMYGVQGNFYTFLEPCFTARFGSENVKLETQVMFSINKSSSTLNHNPFHFHLGLHVNIVDRHR
jgi:hypothetical protein